jgi:para-aminobenzoate synthetase component 1
MRRIVRLEYPADSAALFECVREMPWPVLLESSRDYLPWARYDIIAADPVVKISSDGARTRIASLTETRYSDLDPLEVVRDAVGARAERIENLPFAGGALGYVAYDYGRRHERIGSSAQADIDIPDVAMGIYDWAVVVDHLDRTCWLASHGRHARTLENWDSLVARFSLGAGVSSEIIRFEVTGSIESNLANEAYARAFRAVKAHISAGDCYQINLTQRFAASAVGDPWDAYRRLRRISPAPYAAYLEFPFAQIASSSPEQFLSVRAGHARTKPIKGTRPRSTEPLQDSERARELHLSTKDRAENVMIVDLMRNDFGRCCKVGSVRVTRLLAVESFANVHHLVSTVEGTLRDDCGPVDLLIACFPGGSITGAPKIRSMQIIESLEPHRRSIYCGSIGYIGYDGQMDSNIAIRTLLVAGGRVYAWAGGGIVADSELQQEYQESLDKATAMLQVLGESSEAASSFR